MSMRWLLVVLILMLAACGVAEPRHTAEAAVAAFKAAGLEVETRPLARDEYGLAPYICTEKSLRILIPSLGEDRGGRLYECDNATDAARFKAFYDKMGEGSALLASYTFQHNNLTLQLTNDLTEEQAQAYETALRSVP